MAPFYPGVEQKGQESSRHSQWQFTLTNHISGRYFLFIYLCAFRVCFFLTRDLLGGNL